MNLSHEKDLNAVTAPLPDISRYCLPHERREADRDFRRKRADTNDNAVRRSRNGRNRSRNASFMESFRKRLLRGVLSSRIDTRVPGRRERLPAGNARGIR